MINAQASRRSQLIASQVFTAAGTVDGSLDTIGADYAVITMNFAIEPDTNAIGPTITLTESDDTVVTNFATFAGFPTRTAEDLTAAKLMSYNINLIGRKRYLKLDITAESHATGDLITAGATAELSRLELQPANAAAMVDSGDVSIVG